MFQDLCTQCKIVIIFYEYIKRTDFEEYFLDEKSDLYRKKSFIILLIQNTVATKVLLGQALIINLTSYM